MHLYPLVNVPLYEELSPAAGRDLPRRKECKVFFPTEECYFWPDNFMDWTLWIPALGHFSVLCCKQICSLLDGNPSISKEKINLEAAVFFMSIIHYLLKCHWLISYTLGLGAELRTPLSPIVRSPLEHCERFCSKKRGDFNFIFCSVDTLAAHIVLFSQNKKIKPTCSPWIFPPLRTVRDSAKAEVDRELSGVLHGQPQSQPCSERCCLQQRSGDFRVSASTDLCHLSADPNHPNWEINCNAWLFFLFL